MLASLSAALYIRSAIPVAVPLARGLHERWNVVLLGEVPELSSCVLRCENL